MLRAKSRSGSIDLGHKNHSSIFSRSKLCRGDVIVSQIDSFALVSVDNKPERRINRDISMQGQMEELVEELDRTKEELAVAEAAKDRFNDEIKKIKQDKKVAEIKMSEVSELNSEVMSLKGLLSNSKQELKHKDEKMKYLEMELKSVKVLETELAARDSLIDRLRQEVNNLRESESRVTDLSSDNKKRIMELEAEVEKGKLSELKMLESLQHQTKLLEETKIELEEAKLEMVSLQTKADKRNVNESRNKEKSVQSSAEVDSRKPEIELERGHQLAQALDSEKTKSLQDELALVKNKLGLVTSELKQATDAEETSKKAMDELAIALKEVATESNQMKEKHRSTLLELEHVKEESEHLKDMVRNTEERYQKLLDEAEKETELYRNTADRLRLEAEESLLAWNGKEMGFVNCIKTAEEEKAVAQHEKAKLAEALKATETLTRSARDENFKLRDILKQAINEANAAKAASGIARDENSLLKDSLSEKDEALLIIHEENKRLRINEVAAKENVKEYKKLLSSASMDVKIDNKETNEKSPNSDDQYEEVEEENADKRSSSFDLDELSVIDDQDIAGEMTKPEDPEKAEALKGSIFYSDYSTTSDPHTPIAVANQQRGHSTPFVAGEVTLNSEDHGRVDSPHLYDIESDKNGLTRKKALFRRVSDIIMRKKMIL